MLEERAITRETLAPAQADILEQVDLLRLAVSREQNKSRKTDLGQFFTPAHIAHFMASLLEAQKPAFRILDAGVHPTHLIHFDGERFSGPYEAHNP